MREPDRPEILEECGEIVKLYDPETENVLSINQAAGYESTAAKKSHGLHNGNSFVVPNQKRGCCSCPAVPREDSYDFLVGSKALRLLKLCGVASILFAIVELGLGGALFSMLDNLKFGAWWAGILALFGGVVALYCDNKTLAIITCLLGCSSVIVTAVGAIIDGLGANLFNKLLSCTATDRVSTQQYGDAAYFYLSEKCTVTALNGNSFVSGGCYCSPKNGDCYQFTLSPLALKSGMTCGGIMTRYTQTLTASVAFSATLFLCAIVISYISFALLCCPDRLSKIARPGDEYPENTATIIVGIHGHENTF